MGLRSVLPAHHLSDESKSTVNVGIALIATLTALILGLVTASAKSTFDTVDQDARRISAQLLSLDRLLARYGTETTPLREALRASVRARIELIWPKDGSNAAS